MSISVCSATIHRYMPTCDSDIRNFIYIYIYYMYVFKNY